jgi:hypothetical protein
VVVGYEGAWLVWWLEVEVLEKEDLKPDDLEGGGLAGRDGCD